MSENGRFDWDVLLEQEPEKPPIRTEPQRVEAKPAEFEAELEDTDILERETIPIPENKKNERPKRNRQTEAPKQAVPKKQPQQIKTRTQTRQKQPGMNILKGDITPNQLVNAFILSEIFGKPKSMRRK